jgi:DNA-binding NtrC family response regulator
MNIQRPTILIIDDDVDLRQTLADGLEAAGYAVIQSDDYQSVFAKLPSMRLSAIIVDFMLDNDFGITLLNYVKKHRLLKSLPVIMISGHERAKSAAQQWGANAFLFKPVSIKQLDETLKQFIADAISGGVTDGK